MQMVIIKMGRKSGSGALIIQSRRANLLQSGWAIHQMAKEK